MALLTEANAVKPAAAAADMREGLKSSKLVLFYCTLESRSRKTGDLEKNVDTALVP